MLERVKIRNFQSLEKTEIELGKLTVILGGNDLGKSALFRAIRSAVESASGSDFITYGKTVTSVTLVIDGKELVWEKGASVNRYTLDGVSFEKIGRQVPPDVASFLALGPQQFAKDLDLNLNFSDQDDPPFLIPFPGGMTAASVAKVLGDLTNLNVLYRAITESDTRRKRAESLAKVRRSDVETLQSQMAQFDSLAIAEQHLTNVETLWGDANAAHDYFLDLSYIRNEKEQLRLKYEQLSADEAALGPPLDDQLAELQKSFDNLGELTKNLTQFKELERAIPQLDSAIRLAELEETAAVQEFEALLSEIGTCPLCNQIIDVEHAALIHA